MKIFCLIPISLFLFSSCFSKKVAFHYTEKSLPVDTLIVVPVWVKNRPCYSLKIHNEWNDTIIYFGEKLPKGNYYLDRPCVEGGLDTIRLQFDKYKATKVNISVEYEY
jgi:hypothetical protein